MGKAAATATTGLVVEGVGVGRLVVVEATFGFVPRVYLADKHHESVVGAGLVGRPVGAFAEQLRLVGTAVEASIGPAGTEVEE